eukprot:1411128-Amphidinium_carterae.2
MKDSLQLQVAAELAQLRQHQTNVVVTIKASQEPTLASDYGKQLCICERAAAAGAQWSPIELQAN